MHKLKGKILEFASVIQNINLVEKFIDEICDEYHINNTYFGNILISITETVKNAIIYGNNKNPDKKVRVKFEANPTYLSFYVSDEGKGFEYRDIYNPEDLYNRSNRNKKGLYLITTLSDKVKFYNKGSEIELIFYISSVNLPLSIERLNKVNVYFKEKSNGRFDVN
jgi:serine/threonine-protein kinase RsbW